MTVMENGKKSKQIAEILRPDEMRCCMTFFHSRFLSFSLSPNVWQHVDDCFSPVLNSLPEISCGERDVIHDTQISYQNASFTC